ncbi:hypothetical protein I4U23_006668 [Adineta vaga]|nr:hypothetical protein I4U23_006668 [Adineta vaga]
MHSDSDQEIDDSNQRNIDFKIKRFIEQSQIYFNRLPVLKQQLNDINRVHQYDLYVQKLNEVGKIVQNLVQNIRNIEQLYLQLTEKDRMKLERQICLLRTDSDREMSEFQILREQAMASSIDDNLNNSNNIENDEIPNELRQRQITTNRLNDSYDLLEQDLILLRDTIGEVAQLVAQQKEKISHTEQLVHMAHDQIRHASTFLQKAVQNKYFTLASGALLGAGLGGPLGCLMGLKIGAIAALGGSAVGALSVNIMQHRITQSDEFKDNDNNDSYSQAML